MDGMKENDCDNWISKTQSDHSIRCELVDDTNDADDCVKRVHVGEKSDKDDDEAETDVEDERNKDLPVDRGWAWIVLVGCFFELLIMVGYFKCFGIFFVQIQRRFRATSTATTVVISLQNAFFSISALIVMNLGDLMTSRFAVVLGSCMLSVCFIITGFAENINVVYLFAGVLSGVSFGFVHPNTITMLNTYFERYRGMANSIAGVGTGVGVLSLAPFYTHAFEHYGFTGTHILQAGLALNIVVAGMLLRPLETFRNKEQKVSSEIPLKTNERHVARNGAVAGTEQEISGVTQSIVSLNGHHGSLISLTNTNHFATERHAVNGHTETSLNGHHGSLISLTNTNHSATDRHAVNGHTETPPPSSDRRTCNAVLSAVSRFFTTSVLRKPIFQYFIVVNMLLCGGVVLADAFIAPHAVDSGIKNEQLPTILSSLAISDVCSKFLVGYLSDRKWIQRSTIMAIAAFGLGAASFFMFVMNSFASVLVYAVLDGSLVSMYFCLYPVVAVDILSLKELKSALGFVIMAQGITLTACFPLADVHTLRLTFLAFLITCPYPTYAN